MMYKKNELKTRLDRLYFCFAYSAAIATLLNTQKPRHPERSVWCPGGLEYRIPTDIKAEFRYYSLFSSSSIADTCFIYLISARPLRERLSSTDSRTESRHPVASREASAV